LFVWVVFPDGFDSDEFCEPEFVAELTALVTGFGRVPNVCVTVLFDPDGVFPCFELVVWLVDVLLEPDDGVLGFEAEFVVA
jgi:hypothetical protein